EAAPLKSILDPHRLEETNARDGIRPEERVAGERVAIADREVEVGTVQRALGETGSDLFATAPDHVVRTAVVRLDPDPGRTRRNGRPARRVHPADDGCATAGDEARPPRGGDPAPTVV